MHHTPQYWSRKSFRADTISEIKKVSAAAYSFKIGKSLFYLPADLRLQQKSAIFNIVSA